MTSSIRNDEAQPENCEDGATLREIAAELGVSITRAHQILEGALLKLRSSIDPDDFR